MVKDKKENNSYEDKEVEAKEGGVNLGNLGYGMMMKGKKTTAKKKRNFPF